MTALHATWEVGDFVRPSDRMYLEWAKMWGSKARRIGMIRFGMDGYKWYYMEGFILPFQQHELDLVRKQNWVDKLKERLIS